MLPRIVERKWWYFLASGVLIVPGVVFILIGGLKPGIEFQGGTLLDIRFRDSQPLAEVRSIMSANGHPEAVIQGSEGNRVLVRTIEMQPEQIASVQNRLQTSFGSELLDVTPSAVSASFSVELLRNAFLSVAAASTLIVLLIAFAFRTFGWNALVYGLAAIVALLHDALVVLGLWAILGFFFNIEVDSLFITALLTIIGFSVHDTIVVFDRI